MRRRFFADNMVRMLTLSLLPMLFLTVIFFAVLVPTEKKSLESEAEINLSLLQENVDLLLNDSNKVMNMLAVPAYSCLLYTSIRDVLPPGWLLDQL